MLQRIFSSLFGRKKRARIVKALYQKIVHQSRLPALYKTYGIADTVDGRFDSLLLHMAIVVRRLHSGGSKGVKLSQKLFDVMFRDMDVNLREMGVGDMSVSKHFRRMSRAFNGRIQAYTKALETGGEMSLLSPLANNLYRKMAPAPSQVKGMAMYTRRQSDALWTQPLEDILEGKLDFITAIEH